MNYRKIRTLLAPTTVILVLVLSACTSSQRAAAPIAASQVTKSVAAESDVTPPQRSTHRLRQSNDIAPGFLIKITNLEDESVNGEFRVQFDGQLKLPYDITLQTSGMNERELDAAIKRAFKEYFKSDQSLEVKIVEKKYYVDVRGLVEKPGQYLMNKSSSLDEVVAAAGNLQVTQAQGTLAQYVQIRQMGEPVASIKLSEYYSGAAEAQIPEWQGGDIVFFQSERSDTAEYKGAEETYVQILGEVLDPGEYVHRPGKDFYYYLVRAGGPTNNANLDKVELVHTVNGRRQSERFSLEDLGEKGETPALMAGDIAIVHPDRPRTWINDFGIVISSITSVVLLFLV